MKIRIEFADLCVWDAPDGADYRLSPNAWIEVAWTEDGVRNVRQYPPHAVRSVSITEPVPALDYGEAI